MQARGLLGFSTHSVPRRLQLSQGLDTLHFNLYRLHDSQAIQIRQRLASDSRGEISPFDRFLFVGLESLWIFAMSFNS